MLEAMDNSTQQDELKLLARLSSLINSSLDMTQVLDNALQCVEEFLGAEVSSIFEVDKKSGELFFRLARGAGAEKIRHLRLKMGEGIAGWVAQTEKPLICSDTLTDSRFCHAFDSRSGFATRSILCVPLKAKDRLLGVLEVMNKKGGQGFGESDLELLTVLGNQIGIALDNARLYQRLNEKLAFTLEELRGAQQKLIEAEKLASLGKMALGVAHEVRNPITIIGGFARRLQKLAPPNAKAQDIPGLILAEVDKLARMVSEIEAFAHLPELRCEPAQLGELVERLLGDQEGSLQMQGIQILLRLSPDLPPISGDVGLLRLAFQHLIDNAREAMPHGGALEVAVQPTPTHLEIILRDTGGGIDPRDLPYLFDPFFSTKPQGTGMGLTTVHRIITGHRGDIQIQSTPTGTEVTVLLPRWVGE
jgi:signal transduction histidine kinase